MALSREECHYWLHNFCIPVCISNEHACEIYWQPEGDHYMPRHYYQYLKTWLSSVDKYKFHGKFKARIYKHILSHLLWQLLVYEVLITTVEGLEMKVS